LSCRHISTASLISTAVEKGHKEVSELLINKGAGVNTETVNGLNPLDWAVAFEKAKTADLLRKHGAKTAEELKAEGK